VQSQLVASLVDLEEVCLNELQHISITKRLWHLNLLNISQVLLNIGYSLALILSNVVPPEKYGTPIIILLHVDLFPARRSKSVADQRNHSVCVFARI
jgi:hypothetical protein